MISVDKVSQRLQNESISSGGSLPSVGIYCWTSDEDRNVVYPLLLFSTRRRLSRQLSFVRQLQHPIVDLELLG